MDNHDFNIGDKTYRVERLVYFPFGDKERQIGVRVYLNKI